MSHGRPLTQSKSFTLLLAILAVSFVLCIIIFPDSALDSSMRGLTIWWQMVFPALLPFLVLSELLVATGVVHALGVLLEPLMRSFFRLPGSGGWALSVGWIAGFPAGADAVGKLRHQLLVDRGQGERLLALSHAASPIFIVHVVGVGFLHSPSLGVYVAFVHFISGAIAGFLLRFFSEPGRRTAEVPFSSRGEQSGLLQASWEAMRRARQQDGRSFGKLLSDAVYAAIQTLFVIGGYMMIFSVFLNVLNLVGASGWIQYGFSRIFAFSDVPNALYPHLLTGFMEVNLGAYGVSRENAGTMLWKSAFISSFLAWSGLCMHLQVRSLIWNTDLRYRLFLLSRLLHAVLAFSLTVLLWPVFIRVSEHILPAVSLPFVTGERHPGEPLLPYVFLPMLLAFAGQILLMVCASLIIHRLRRIFL